MSINRQRDKEDVVHISSGILLGQKKNERMPPAATQTDLETLTLSEVSQRQTPHDSYAGSKRCK